jgi:hypothetical protein
MGDATPESGTETGGEALDARGHRAPPTARNGLVGAILRATRMR